MLPILHKSLVRPHLEFGNLVWGPFNRTGQKKLERVQRRETRLVTRLRHLPYETRLKNLQLPSLYYRRKRGDMIFTYQLFHNGVDADPAGFFSLASGRSTRGHPFKICKPTAACRVRISAFAIRVINDWNSLPNAVVCSLSRSMPSRPTSSQNICASKIDHFRLVPATEVLVVGGR